MGIRYSIGAAAAALPLIVTGVIAAPASAAPQVAAATSASASASGTTAKTVCFNAKQHRSKVVGGATCAGANWKPVANLGKKLAKVSASKKKTHVLCVRNSSGQAKVVTKKCPRGYKKYTAAKLGLVGPTGPAGPAGPPGLTGVSTPSSVMLVDWDTGVGTATLAIPNYDPALTYSFTSTPSATFGAITPCTLDPSDYGYGWSCVTAC